MASQQPKPGSLQGILPFVHAVEAGSFTLAAERLGVTASAVGKSVARTEQRLGTRLMNRSTRSVSLTSDGEAYYRACVAALAEIDAIEARLAAGQREPAGRLRLDIPLAFGRRRIAPILFEIAAQHPQLVLEVGFNDRRVDLIEEGVDLAIRMGELGDSAGLVARKLFVQRWTICAAPGYLERHGRPRTLADLAGHSLINYGRNGSAASWPWRERDRAVTYNPRSRLILGHGEPLLDAVLAGAGISYLPTWLIEESVKRGTVELLWPDILVENVPVHALWPKARAIAPKIRVVVDALVRRLAPAPWDRAYADRGRASR